MAQQIPTVTAGLDAPNAELCTADTCGSEYLRGTAADGAAIKYRCKLTNAATGTYGWVAVDHNADL